MSDVIEKPSREIPPMCRWVLVADQIVQELTQWSEPVRVKIERVGENELEMIFERVDDHA